MHVPTRLLTLVELFGLFTLIIAFGIPRFDRHLLRSRLRPFASCARSMSLYRSAVTDREPLRQPNG